MNFGKAQTRKSVAMTNFIGGVYCIGSSSAHYLYYFKEYRVQFDNNWGLKPMAVPRGYAG